MNTSHIVKIGEICIGKNNEVLKATLGSCVGIAFFWSEKNMIGLAHCLLPETDTPNTQLGAKYVNQAVKSIMSMMKIRSENIKEIKALVVGGGYMMPIGKIYKKHIGNLNIEAARKYINEAGINIFYEDVGGSEARQIIIECSDESFKIRKIIKP
jgi:chemotaxis protein CheD